MNSSTPRSVSQVRRIIMHADDFGVSRGANVAIADSYRRGMLTSASVMATLPALGHAKDLIPEVKGIGFGAHFSLTLGRPVAPPSSVGLLLDRDGFLEYSYAFHMYRSFNKEYLYQVKIELEAQLAKLYDHGFALDHADSQQHVHMIPRIRDVVAETVESSGIPHLRHSVEPWTGHPSIGQPLNLLKCATVASFAAQRPNHRSRVGFIGLRHTGRMTADRLVHYLTKLGPGTWEIAVHPGTGELEDDRAVHQPIAEYLRHKDRRVEWEALTSKRVRECADATCVDLIRFADV